MKMTAPLEVGLVVRDLPSMMAFYQAAFGLTVVADVTVPAGKADEAALSAQAYRVVRMQTPWGERLKLLAPERPPEARPAQSRHILDRHDASYITFIVDDFEAVVASAIASGAQEMTGPGRLEVRPGTYLSFLRDPEGHIVEVVKYADISAYRDDLADAKK